MKAAKIIKLFFASALVLSLSGCYLSRTTIATTDGRDYQVYGNGILICENSTDCKIGQRGTPNTLELEAVKGGAVVGKKTIKREITTASVMWGFFTYFTTLFLYQAYPDNVYIPIDYNNGAVSDLVRIDNNRSNDWNTSPYQRQSGSWDAPMSPQDNTNSAPAPTDDSAVDEY